MNRIALFIGEFAGNDLYQVNKNTDTENADGENIKNTRSYFTRIETVCTDFAEEASFATVHEVGVAQGVSEDILKDLRANFEGECSEVGMYLAMARVAHREGYPEIGLYYEKAAYEEAEHAAKFAELLGEVVTDSTKKNLEMRVEAENGATAGKFDLAKRAKAANLDAIHDTVHEMAKDEARHGKAFEGLLKRYFG